MTSFAMLFARRPDSAANAIKPGLDRMRVAYEELGRPGADIPTVLVGGTNGKGSTAGQLWQMLSLAGETPGLFTSPHLLHFSERFQIAGQELTDEVLVSEWQLLQEDLRPATCESLSFFEVATLLALRLFARREVSTMILEVGLGGRWDSTNVVEPILSIITSIGRDHEQYLGSDLAGIAREKAGIMRPDRLALWGGSAEPVVQEAMERAARETGARLQTFGRDFSIPSLSLPAPVYQQTNLSLAAKAARERLDDRRWALVQSQWDGPKVMPHCMRGRLEWWRQAFEGRDVLVDVCHNPAGAQAFAAAAADVSAKTVFVTTSSDKDQAAMAEALAHKFSCIVFFGTSAERCWRPDQGLPAGTVWAEDLPTAIRTYAKPDEPLVVCGSVLGVGALVRDHVLQVSWR